MNAGTAAKFELQRTPRAVQGGIEMAPKKRGPKEERLKIEGPWGKAVEHALGVGVPEGGIPDRPTSKRAPGAGRPKGSKKRRKGR